MTKTKTKPIDVHVEGSGTIRIIQPLTAKGWEWVKQNMVFESWQVVGGGIAVEPRMVQNIIDGMTDAGLKVQS